MAVFMDLKGTTQSTFQLGKGGPKLKSVSGVFQARNAADSAYVDIIAAAINAAGDSITINSDAAEAGADWKLTIARPVAGMTQNLTFTLPGSYGSSGQFLQSDGAGNTSWASAGGGGGTKVYRGFGLSGSVVTGASVALPILIRATGTIQSVKAYCRTAPTGGSVDLDVKKNGVTIFSALPSIAASANLSSTGTLSVTSVVADDILELDVTNNAASFAQDLTVVIAIQE